MHPLTSPRLSGVPILKLTATGPDFSRWRRSVKFALETKGTWQYCNGACPMPMPEVVSSSTPSEISNRNVDDSRPSLLEERRAWVRQDREVKLDIFLSLAEDVMQEVFNVGPPLPPSNLYAYEMMEALIRRFAAFNFEPYHHTFCHFLNIHIDQYDTLDDFNREFSATLEDLLDHGHPLSNVQACSAYFSKLRCTQNPWVVKKLENWDVQPLEPQLVDLMEESPPWSVIRPLATKSSQHHHHHHADLAPEEEPEDSPAQSETDSASEFSADSITSSRTSHSRNRSSISTNSFEITVHAASEDFKDIETPPFQKRHWPLSKLIIPDRRSSHNGISSPPIHSIARVAPMKVTEERKLPRLSLPSPINRPNRVILPQSTHERNKWKPLPHISPPLSTTVLTNSAHEVPTTPAFDVNSASPPQLSLAEHPAFRADMSRSSEHLAADVHPTLRPATYILPPVTTISRGSTSTGRSSSPHRPMAAIFDFPERSFPASSLAVPWPGTPDETAQARSPLGALPHHGNPPSLNKQLNDRKRQPQPVGLEGSIQAGSTTSSLVSLPLQGTQEKDYFHRGSHHPSPSVSPMPQPPIQPRHPHSHIFNAQLVARLGRESVFESSKETAQSGKKQQKKRGWSLSGNLSKFGHGKGVKEIV